LDSGASGREEIRSFFLAVGLLQAWDPRSALMWNGPGWSLSAEAFFYTCFPLITKLSWKPQRPLAWAGWFAALWMAAIVVPVLLTVQGLGYGPASAFGERLLGAPPIDLLQMDLVKFNPALRLAEFCMGIFVYKIFVALRQRWSQRGYWFYMPGMLGILIALAFAQKLPYLLAHNGLLLPLFAGVILGLALEGGFVATFLKHSPLVFLGQSSYALYIIHAPLFLWMTSNTAQKIFRLGGMQGMMIYVVVAVVAGSIVFKTIEEPMNRRLRSRLG
jgi:peptidoglycan/LPS O-acetylase OafA/YrhL